MADLVVVAARTNPEAGSRGFSLFVVERDTPGFRRGRQLEKIGLPAQDTAELFFDDALLPAENLLGEEGRGLQYLMSHLPRERLGVVAQAIATTRAIFTQTVEYCRQRNAFGQPLTANQHIRFELADMATEIDVTEAYVDKSVEAFNAGELSPSTPRRANGMSANSNAECSTAACNYTGLRLHGRVPGRPSLSRHPCPNHLRRDDGNHEGTHRPRARRLTTRLSGNDY